MTVSRVLFFAWLITACVPPEVPIPDEVIEEPIPEPKASLDGEWIVNFAEGGTARLSLLGGDAVSGDMTIDKFVFRSVYGTATTNTYELEVLGYPIAATGTYAVAGTTFTLIAAKTKAEGRVAVEEKASQTRVINGLWNIGNGDLGQVRWAQAGSVLLGTYDEDDDEPVIFGVVKPDGVFFAEYVAQDLKAYYQGTFNADRTVATVHITTATLALDAVYNRVDD